MPKIKKRSYKSEARHTQAAQTRSRILLSAKHLFASEGFECVTIEKIAHTATVSVPTVYALFQSKRGILRALMDQALAPEQFDALVEESIQAQSPQERLCISAKIARLLYDAEKNQMETFRSAALLAPEFKELENEREIRRYERQEITIQAMVQEKSLAEGLSVKEARDILWTFTGRDLYRMFVVEQKWTSETYETWLSQWLILALTGKER